MKKGYLYRWTIDQRFAIENNLDLDIIDLSILAWMDRFSGKRECKRLDNNGVSYFLFNWSLIPSQLPLLGIKSRQGVLKRYKKLIEANLIKPHPQNKSLKAAWYCFTDFSENLHFSQGKEGKTSVNESVQSSDSVSTKVYSSVNESVHVSVNESVQENIYKEKENKLKEKNTKKENYFKDLQNQIEQLKKENKNLKTQNEFLTTSPEDEIETEDSGYPEHITDFDKSFEKFWKLYDFKKKQPKAKQQWANLSYEEREKVFEVVEQYVKLNPDKRYRPAPNSFLENKEFNDELVDRRPKDKPTNDQPKYTPPEKVFVPNPELVRLQKIEERKQKLKQQEERVLKTVGGIFDAFQKSKTG